MPRKQKKYHYLYKTTNLINNKFYVGMHSTDDLEDGYLGSGKYLRRSINKHGKENFKVIILEFFESRKDLVEREKNLVNEDFIKVPLCMNIRVGGEGGSDGIHGFNNKETAIKGRLITNKILHERLQIDLVYRERVCRAISDGLKGKDNGKWTGRTHKEETKKQMSNSHKGKHVGEKNSQFGTCWVLNLKLKENKKIKIEELQSYISNDWIKGRRNF